MWQSCYQEELSPDLPHLHQTDGTIHLQCATNKHQRETPRAIATGVLRQDVEASEGSTGEADLTMIATCPEGRTHGPDHRSVAEERGHIRIHGHRHAPHHQEDEEEAHWQEALRAGAEAQATAHIAAAAGAEVESGHAAEIDAEVGEVGGLGRWSMINSAGQDSTAKALGRVK